jgi:hypothetical protein
MRRRRYLEKLEMFEGEMGFIKTHQPMRDELTKRALLYEQQHSKNSSTCD